MQIDGVIFDFNGTLFKDSKYHESAWQQISYELTGTKMSIDDIRHYSHGACNEAVIDRFTNHTLSKEENLFYSRKKEALYRQMVQDDSNSAHLVDGAQKLFDYLKENQIPFTIASASIKENIDFFFDFFQLNQWFDPNQIIYDNGTYPNKVPMFLDALKELQCDKENTLIFEDSFSGYQSAKEAGFKKIIMIYDDSKTIEEMQDFPFILKFIRTFDELF